jgi:hypothetical protein
MLIFYILFEYILNCKFTKIYLLIILYQSIGKLKQYDTRINNVCEHCIYTFTYGQ